MADRAHYARALSYDPASDVAQRHPGWIVSDVDLGGLVPEVLCWRRRVILIDSSSPSEVRRSSLAHAVAHVDLDHAWTLAGFFEKREEVQADRLAAQRLIPLDAFAQAVAWSRDRAEVASVLGVDLPMLEVRLQGLSRAERRTLRCSSRAAAFGI